MQLLAGLSQVNLLSKASTPVLKQADMAEPHAVLNNVIALIQSHDNTLDGNAKKTVVS